MTPEVFAPSIVSTNEYSENNCKFLPDGKYLFFAGKGGIPDNKINMGECFFLFEYGQKLFEKGHIELNKR